MNWVLLQIKDETFIPPLEQPYFSSPPPPITPKSDSFNLNSKVSPSILLIIIILAIIFFVSGLLHLLVRFILRPNNREPDDVESVTALQGQLQQLFHLHDAGVDQSFIDTLPVFQYKAIIGSKNPFDCAVCLCEFEPEDKLRLLPKCSHAFHVDCIDTWLLSHSTCPLCRSCLLPDFSPNHSCSPIVFVLESGGESSREIVTDRESVLGRTSSVVRTNSLLGFHGGSELGSARIDFLLKSTEIVAKDEGVPCPTVVVGDEKIVPVKLGKFRNVDGGGEGTSNSELDERRCFSMGSFAYVMDENSSLQVPIRTPMKKPPIKKPSLPLTPGHRLAMSECDFESKRNLNGFEAIKSSEMSDVNGKAIGSSKAESFSVSKIWLRGKKEKLADSSRRAFSFRFPVHWNVGGTDSMKERTISEIGIGRWENGRSESGCDIENQSCNSLDSQANPPSFARRTLLWFLGRQNKVVHSSFTPNI